MTSPTLARALELLATPESYRAWLRDNYLKPVGYPGTTNCPTYMYLFSHGVRVIIGSLAMTDDSPTGCNSDPVDLPSWVRQHEDDLAATFKHGHNVLGAEAMAVLRSRFPEGGNS